MIKKKHESQDVYFRASEERWLHRCPICWVDGDRVDNGFISFNQEYPHADNCPLKGKF